MANISPCFTDFNNEKTRVTEIYINFATSIDLYLLRNCILNLIEMKKYLMTGVLALTFGALVVGCTDDDNDFTSIAEVKQATFAENFKKFYGDIDPNQDWGFGSTTAASRLTRTINSGWTGWASAPNDNDFKSTIPGNAIYIGSYGDRYKDEMHNYYLASTQEVQSLNPYNGNFALYVQGNKKIAFSNPGNGSNHMYFYVLPGADLTITTYFDLNAADDFKMYVAEGAKVTFEVGLNCCMKLYNRGQVVVKGSNASGIYSNGVIYNQGTMTFEGTGQQWTNMKPADGNVSTSLYLANQNSQFINEGTVNTKGLYLAGSSHFKNVSGGEVNVSGYTIVNSNQLSWINDGVYNTGYFSYTAGSTDVINNCRLNVSETFYMNLGDTDVNSFQMDGGSSVVCKNYFGDAPGFIKMGSKSLFKVTETATMNHTKANYGIYCVGNDYAVFQAKNIVATNIAQAYEVTYGGKLYVVAQTHFDSPNFSSKSGDYPIIDFKNGFTKSNIYLGGDTPDIKISASTCNPGFPEGYSDEGDLNIIDAGTSTESNVQKWETKRVIDHKRVFCEDLGSASNRRDYDYNDVVFDAKIIESYFEDRTYENGQLVSTTSSYGLNYYAEITVLAAGGELSLTVGGKEVNNLFDKPINMIINTVSPADMETFAASHNREVLSPVSFKYVFPANQQNLDSAIIKNIPVMVEMQNTAIYLRAEKGEAPQKICVPVGTRWAYERVPIDEAYGNFTDWVGHTQNFTPETLWGTNADESKLYPNIGATTDETGTVTRNRVTYTESNTSFTFNPSDTETIAFDQSANEGQSLSSTAIDISSSYFSASSKGSIVRLYGVDNGNAQISVMAGSVALGKTTRAVGKAYIYTLSTAQAAAAKENGLQITGSDFKLYYVTVDDTDIDRTVEVEPTFNTSELTGTAITGISQTQLTAAGVNVAAGNFAEAAAGTEVYVYGTGDDSSVSVSVNGSALDKVAASRQTRGITYKNKTKKTVKFTMTTEQAAAAQTSGIKITGSNFTLHAVSVVIVKESTPSEKREQRIWSTTSPENASHITISNQFFKNASDGDVLRIKGTLYKDQYGNEWGWNLIVVGHGWQTPNLGWPDAVNGVMGCKISKDNGGNLWNRTDGYIDIKLTDSLVSFFSTNGLYIQTDWLAITEVTVFSKGNLTE